MTDFHIRASSWASLLDCPMRWAKQNLEGMRLPTTPPALIGSAVHASTAAYDQSKLDGTNMSIDDSLDVAMEIIAHPEEEVDWMGTARNKAEETALRVHMSYCTEVAPYENYLLVEHHLEPMEINMGSVTIVLTGTLDRIREVGGRKGVADVKTGGRAIKADGTVIVGKHAAQLATYTMLAENLTGEAMDLPPAIIALQTTGKARAAIDPVYHTKEALLGTDTEPGLLDFAANYFNSGLFPPNPGSFLCSERYCPHFKNCKFHG